MYKTVFKIIIVIFLLSFYGFLLAKKVDLTTADLGRHLKNGEIVLNQGLKALESNSVINSNFYSYTHPTFPFINHHWLSGVIFFVLERISGFTGLSLFYIFLSWLTFLIFFFVAKSQADFKTSVIASLLLIPLIAQRKEIRPEVFGYFLGAVFLGLLIAYQKNKIAKSRLLILPFLTLFWVNLHISFFIGLFLIGVFWLEKLIKIVPSFQKRGTEGVVGKGIKKKSSLGFSPLKGEDSKVQILHKFKWLSLILGLSAAVSFLNPNTWRGAIYPLKIFENYGYQIVENQSIMFLENYGLSEPNLLHFEVVFGILVLSFVVLLIKKNQKIQISHCFLAIAFSILAWFGLRNFTLFGFFMMPVLASNISGIVPKRLKSDSLKLNLSYVLLAIVIMVFIDLNSHDFLIRQWQSRGLGLTSKVNKSAEFFKEQDIQGPIFNNYDIGSFLIYHLYPKHKVFVENRPEAYPIQFFQDDYIPMQEDNEVWERQNKNYDFKAIFFGYHDLTPWAQDFLISRVDDPAWAPVFADNYAIIFLKRNGLNQEVIDKFEIPRNNFRVLKK